MNRVPKKTVGSSRGLPLRLAWLALALLACGCGEARSPSAFDRSALLPVPHPTPESLEPIVRDDLAAGRRALDERLADPTAKAEEVARAFGELGLRYHAYELAEAAAACYGNAKSLAPGESRWTYAAARLAADFRGDLEAAVAGFEAVLRQRPDDLPALLHLGHVRLQAGENEAAAAAFKRVLELDPGSAAGHDGLGRVAAAKGDLPEAIARYRKTLELQASATKVQYRLAQVLRQAGDLAGAEAALARQGPVDVFFADPFEEELGRLATGVGAAIRSGAAAQLAGDVRSAIESYRRAVALDPNDAAARQSLGAMLARAGDLAGAIEQTAAAVELAPGNALPLHNLGQLLLRAGRVDEAEARFRAALVAEPTMAEARLGLAAVFERRESFTAALREYDAVLAQDPAHLVARTRKAVALARSGETAAARAELASVVAAAPELAEAHLHYGTLLAREGALGQAQGELELVLGLEAAPEDKSHARRMLALLEMRQGRPERALERLAENARAEPGAVAPLLELGAALASQRRFGDAAQTYEQALALAPDLPQAWLAEAKALALAGRLPEARAQLETGETLAMALAATGRFEEAVALQREVLETAGEGGDPVAKERRRQNLGRYQRGEPAIAF